MQLRAVWAGSAQALIPMGLLAWVAFTVTFVLGSGSYVASTISDPLGWGWRLFGLDVSWAPLLTDLRPWLQLASWLFGLVWASRIALRVSRRLFGAGSRGGIVLVLGLALLTGGLMWLGLG